MPGQFREGKYVEKTLHMRNWAHASLIDRISSVPLKDLARKVQQRVNLVIEQQSTLVGRTIKTRNYTKIEC